jgi:hypothetical protein
MTLSFGQLQDRLRRQWQQSGSAPDEHFDQLIVPSLSLEEREIALVPGVHHYEERQLFELIRLRHPHVRATYVTSKLLPDLVVDAVLELLPSMPTAHARRRLSLFDADDASARPLSEKLLERPALLRRIAAGLRPERTVMTCFNVSPLERALSERLQVPLLGTDPALDHWGSKAGSRELFARAGVPHPAGSDLVHDLEALAEATADLWGRCRGLTQCVVKLNHGFSGEGNARLPLAPLGLEELGARERLRCLRQALETLPMPVREWPELMARQGALVEAWLEPLAGEQRSPSVQGVIQPDGSVEVVSTHEQILGGPSGQTYLGCRFPADPAYRSLLQQHGRAIGAVLAREGALDRFSVDFIARRHGPADTAAWDLQAIEINLRQGGTTHPFMALRHTTGGRLDPASGVFRTPTGQPLAYRATDNLCDPRLRGLLPIDLIELVAEADLHFDPARQRGSIFHLLGCLSEHGKLGMTCIGRSGEEAERVYAATGERLLRHAERLQECQP